MKNTFFRIKNFNAFSLSELLVAMAILAFVISSLLLLFVSVALMNEANSQMIIAAHDAEYVMEQIRALPTDSFDALDAYIVPQNLTDPATSRLRNETITVDPGSGFNMRIVNVTLEWNERKNRRRQFSLLTQITLTF